MSTEVNLMRCVIKSVAVFGFENASVKTIAQEAGTSASTIYCHYENKEAMFEATFMYLAKIFCDFYSTDHSNLADEDKENSFRRLWNHYLEFFLSKPEEALFYIRYRHSAYYTEEIRLRVQNYEQKFYKSTGHIAEVFGLRNENGSASEVMRFFLEAVLLYSEQRLLGKAERKHDDLAFQTVFGAMMALEMALAKQETVKI